MTERFLLTDRDVERDYGIPRSTQAKGRMTGSFCPHVKRGRSVFYLRTDIENWLAGLRRKSTSDDATGITPSSPPAPNAPRRRGRPRKVPQQIGQTDENPATPNT